MNLITIQIRANPIYTKPIYDITVSLEYLHHPRLVRILQDLIWHQKFHWLSPVARQPGPSSHAHHLHPCKTKSVITVLPKNFHGSSDICPMGFIYPIQIFEISHQTFGPSHRKCQTCPMIFVNAGYNSQLWNGAFRIWAHCYWATHRSTSHHHNPTLIMIFISLNIEQYQWFCKHSFSRFHSFHVKN